MKTYNIPILWQSYKRYYVKAESLEEDVELDLKKLIKEPDDNYLDDSFEIDDILGDDYPDEEFDLNKVLQKI